MSIKLDLTFCLAYPSRHYIPLLSVYQGDGIVGNGIKGSGTGGNLGILGGAAYGAWVGGKAGVVMGAAQGAALGVIVGGVVGVSECQLLNSNYLTYPSIICRSSHTLSILMLMLEYATSEEFCVCVCQYLEYVIVHPILSIHPNGFQLIMLFYHMALHLYSEHDLQIFMNNFSDDCSIMYYVQQFSYNMASEY